VFLSDQKQEGEKLSRPKGEKCTNIVGLKQFLSQTLALFIDQ